MGLYRRGKVWWMSITHNNQQIRRTTGTAEKKLAEKILAKVMTQIAEDKWFERPCGEDRTLKELLNKYIKEHSVPTKAKHTVKQEEGFARQMVEFFGDIPLKEIKPSRISAYKSHLRDRGLSGTSINHQRGFLCHAFKKAVMEWEWLRDNPVEKVSREKVRNARDRWLTQEEEKRLLDCCVIYATGRENVQIPHYWLREVVLFALMTGMRQDEILSLEWPHVNLISMTATVMRAKNGEKRTIPLNGTARELLEAKSKVRHIKSKHVFASEAGTKIDHRNLRRAFYNALEKAEIEDFRFHDLRHTFATRLAQAGIDQYKIAKLLGHKTIAMTQRYSHHYPESLRDGVEVLDRIITNLSQHNEKGATAKPQPLDFMAPREGFEPPTRWLTATCSAG